MPDFFQVDLSQTKWRPARVQDLLDELQRAFEGQVIPQGVDFVGLDSSGGKRRLESDADVRLFSGAKDPDAEGEGEEAEEDTSMRLANPSAIKMELPEAFATELRQPKRQAALATGRQVAKWVGEVPSLGVEFALNVFECGHFRLKEGHLRKGGSSSPASGKEDAISEGRWEENAEGVKLELMLCYTSHPRISKDSVLYGLPSPEQRFALLVPDPTEQELLRGSLPSSLSEGPVGEVLLRREEDMIAKSRREPVRRAPAPADDDDDDWECREMLKPQLKKSQWQPPKPPRREWDDDWDSDEPRWPMYLGIFLFIFIFVVFAYLWYEETYSTEATKEFDEL